MKTQFYLSPPDDGQGGGEGPDMGTDSIEAAANTAQASIGPLDGQPGPGEQQPEPFFSFTDEKGKEVSFMSPDELKQKFADYGMLRSDYTRKTQELAEQRKQFEENRDKMFQTLKEKKAQFDKFDRLMKERPELFRRLESEIQRPASPMDVIKQSQRYADEKLSPVDERIKALEDRIKRQDMEKERQEIFGEFKNRYSDFDEEAVQNMIGEIVPGDMRSLVNMLYYASKGKMSPAQMERKFVENTQKKQQARLMPGNTPAPPPPVKEFSSIDAAREAAMKDIQGG